MRIEHLPLEHVAHPKVCLRHESDVLSLRIHDHVFVGLLKAHHDVHELQLPSHNYSGVGKDAGGRMLLIEYAIRIFRDVDWGEKVVCFGIRIMQGVGYCING